MLAGVVEAQSLADLNALTVAPESRCSPYERSHYSYPQSVEEQIVQRQGGAYSPYDGTVFESLGDSDIEHIVATSEAHDSGMCAEDRDARKTFARDLDNLTLATPQLNRHQKSGKDAGEWLPAQNRCWFAQTIVHVKKKYALSVDQREYNALRGILVQATCGGGVTVSESALALTELGSSNAAEKTYTVALASDPTADVTITVANGDATAVEVDTDSGAAGNQHTLTFTHGSSGNWATAQTVTVRALNDGDGDNESFEIAHSASAASGPYDGATISPVAVTTTDAGHGVVVSESGLSVAENGGADTYAIVLNSQPAYDVMVIVSSGTPGAATVNAPGGTAGAAQTLTFSPSGSNAWNRAQTIAVAGVDDNIDNPEDSRSSTISHAISSSDANYNNLSLPDVTVTVHDDDDAPAEIALSVDNNSVAENDGATLIAVTATVQGSTRFASAQTVAVTIAGSGGANVVGFAATPSAFDIVIDAGAQTGAGTFTLAPTNNSANERDETVTASGSLTGVTVRPATILLADDDEATPPPPPPPPATPLASFAQAAASVTESAGTHDVTVNVSPAPTVDVTVDYSLSGTAARGADYAISGAGSVLVGANQSAVIIPVAIADDSEDEPSETVILTLTSGTGYDVGSASVHTLTIADNDEDAGGTGSSPPPPPSPPAKPEVTLSVSPIPVVEGEEATVTVSLSQRVSRTVTIPLVLTAGAAEEGDYGALASIVIEANQPNGTGVIATMKDDDTDDETFTVALGTLPEGFAAGAQTSVEVTISDDTDVTSIEPLGGEIPVAFALEQNYPNPFNPSTEIAYELPASEYVRLEVFDRTGRRVALLVDGARSPGRHTVRFEASGLPSGLYVYRMQTGRETLARKMVLVR